jgi:hypothetical protein
MTKELELKAVKIAKTQHGEYCKFCGKEAIFKVSDIWYDPYLGTIDCVWVKKSCGTYFKTCTYEEHSYRDASFK